MTASKPFIAFFVSLLIFGLFLLPAYPEDAQEKAKAAPPPAPVLPRQEDKSRVNPESLQLLRLEMTFANGQYYQVVKKGESLPKPLCRIVTQGQGTLTGVWKIDDQVVLPLQLSASGYQDISLPPGKLPTLSTYITGPHHIRLFLDNVHPAGALPVLRYFVSTEAPLKGLVPQQGQQIQLGEEILLKWSSIKGDYQYQVAISQIPFQFLADSQISWGEKTDDPEFPLSLSGDLFSSDYVYWMVRAVSATGRIVSTSEINFFLVTDLPPGQGTEEVVK